MDGDLFDAPEQFEPWAKLGEIQGLPSDLSTELLENLKPWLNERRILVESESDKYYNLIGSNFPIGVNRLDWRGVGGHLELNVLPELVEGLSREKEKESLSNCRHVFLEWFRSAGIDQHDQIVWTGDETKVSLHMTIETFLEVYPQLFTFPQHHYVLPRSSEWCLNYTMEGQLFFGLRQNSISKGYGDLDATNGCST